MNKLTTLKSDALLVLTAAIWGFAFVAQRMGMDHIGPFYFNGIRFVLGGLSLLPLLLVGRNDPGKNRTAKGSVPMNELVWAGILCGGFLFAGASFQQVGMVYTTAGKAGFITGLYVVFVPFFNVFLRQEQTSAGSWIGAFLAVTGMFLLSVTEQMHMAWGDFLVLLCAACFAGHLLVVGRYSGRVPALYLCLVQYLVCAVLSLVTAAVFEPIEMEGVRAAAIPLLYGGIMSVGVAYSLQVVGQQKSPASHAAVILSLESVFAAVGGWLILGEMLTGRGKIGCMLILAGMLVSQLYRR